MKVGQNNVNEISIKTCFKSVYTFFFVVSISLSVNSQILKQKHIDKTTISWVENYFIDKNYFNFLKDSSEKIIYPNEITCWYHIHFIEEKKYDSISVAIFQIGMNSSASHDFFLIRKKRKHKEYTFDIIGADLNLENTVLFYNFFSQYKKFSLGAIKLCYEKIISDYYYYNIVYPKVTD